MRRCEQMLGVWASGNTVVAVGGSVNAVIARSTDGGLTWGTVATPQAAVTLTTLAAIWGASPTELFAAGDKGIIIHSLDAGATWTTMTTPTSRDLKAIVGRSATDVYAVGGFGKVLHYDGNAWSEIATPDSRSAYRGVDRSG